MAEEEAASGTGAPRSDLFEPEDLAERFEVLANPRRLRLLRFLTQPHYLAEIASFLGISRQAAQGHVNRLVDEGLLARRTASRESGPVTEYTVVPEALAGIHEEIERLSRLRPRETDHDVQTEPGDEPRPIGPPRPGPALWVVRGLDAGSALELPYGGEASWLVGRDSDCDLVLEADPFASAKHAEIWREGSTVHLADLASTNGTFHNGDRMGRGDDPELCHGDMIAIGRSLIVFWSE